MEFTFENNKKILLSPLKHATNQYKMMMIKMKISYMAWMKGI